jgi:hypothetical protein
MKTLNKQQLLAVLEDIKKSIENNDSMEGRISYSVMSSENIKSGEFEVDAIYRVGNSEGQGSIRIV